MSEEKKVPASAEYEEATGVNDQTFANGYETIRMTRLLHNHQYGIIAIEQERVLTTDEGSETRTHMIHINEGLFDQLIDALNKLNRHMEFPEEEYGS